jgi:predicted GNAT family N-acyltransferase
MGIVFSKIQNLLFGMLKPQQDRIMGNRDLRGRGEGRGLLNRALITLELEDIPRTPIQTIIQLTMSDSSHTFNLDIVPLNYQKLSIFP